MCSTDICFFAIIMGLSMLLVFCVINKQIIPAFILMLFITVMSLFYFNPELFPEPIQKFKIERHIEDEKTGITIRKGPPQILY